MISELNVIKIIKSFYFQNKDNLNSSSTMSTGKFALHVYDISSSISIKVFVREKKSATEKERATESFLLMKLNTKPLKFIKMRAGGGGGGGRVW